VGWGFGDRTQPTGIGFLISDDIDLNLLLPILHLTIDLYLIHSPNPGPERRTETWNAMQKLVALGKVKSIGESFFLFLFDISFVEIAH